MPIEVKLDEGGGIINPVSAYLRAGGLACYEGRDNLVVITCNEFDNGGDVYSVSKGELTDGSVQDVQSQLVPENRVAELPYRGQTEESFTAINGMELIVKSRHLAQIDIYEHEEVEHNTYDTERVEKLLAEDMGAARHYRLRLKNVEEDDSLFVPEFTVYVHSVKRDEDGDTTIAFTFANPKRQGIKQYQQTMVFPEDGLLKTPGNENDGEAVLVETGYFLPDNYQPGSRL
jgi:hypothetical protein